MTGVQTCALPISTTGAEICPGSIVWLIADAQGGTGSYSFDWSGSGTIDNPQSESTSVVPQSQGTYTIMVVDGCGNTGTADANVEFLDCVIIVPNVFTPNKDGQNEYFVVYNLDKYPNSHLVVFNRWGIKVYENSDYQNDWDGGNLADGTYYFILSRPEKEIVKGYVTILR